MQFHQFIGVGGIILGAAVIVLQIFVPGRDMIAFDPEVRVFQVAHQQYNAVILGVYPNPAETFITLQYSVQREQPLRCLIVNAAGAIQKEIKVSDTPGLHIMQIPLSELSSGMYFVQLQTNDRVYARPFALQ